MQNTQSENTRGAHKHVVGTPAPPGYQERVLAEVQPAEGMRSDVVTLSPSNMATESPMSPSRVDIRGELVLDKVVSERHPISTKSKRTAAEVEGGQVKSGTRGGSDIEQQALPNKKTRQSAAVSSRSSRRQMTLAEAAAEQAAKASGTGRKVRSG